MATDIKNSCCSHQKKKINRRIRRPGCCWCSALGPAPMWTTCPDRLLFPSTSRSLLQWCCGFAQSPTSTLSARLPMLQFSRRAPGSLSRFHPKQPDAFQPELPSSERWQFPMWDHRPRTWRFRGWSGMSWMLWSTESCAFVLASAICRWCWNNTKHVKHSRNNLIFVLTSLVSFLSTVIWRCKLVGVQLDFLCQQSRYSAKLRMFSMISVLSWCSPAAPWRNQLELWFLTAKMRPFSLIIRICFEFRESNWRGVRSYQIWRE